MFGYVVYCRRLLDIRYWIFDIKYQIVIYTHMLIVRYQISEHPNNDILSCHGCD